MKYLTIQFSNLNQEGEDILKDRGVQEIKLVNVEHTECSMPRNIYPKKTSHPHAIMLSK